MKKIAFVVGAGASCEFDGFPVGSQLAQIIEDRLSRDLQNREGPIIDAVSLNGGFGQPHSHAMNRIIQGIHSRDSIDQFVDDCGDELVARISKLSIAHAILSAESTCKLRVDDGRRSEAVLREVRNSWLGRICRFANPGVNRQNFLGALEGVSFITFNYDRSIERFLTLWAESTLLTDYDTAANLVAKVPIKHVFGSVGQLPGFPMSGPVIPFGVSEASVIWRAAQGIKTFTEEVASGEAEEIREILRATEKIVFLGCHFHRPNMQILFAQGWPHRKHIFATTVGMRTRWLNAVINGFSDSGCSSQHEALKCDPFMESNGDDIFDT